MGAGRRWPQGAGTARVVDGSTTVPADATSVVIANEVPVRYWHTSIVATQTVELVPGQTMAIATLAAPPPGQTYVIERVVAANPDAADGMVMLLVGTPNLAGAVDVGSLVPTYTMIFCDPQPVRVPPSQPFYVGWLRDNTDGCSARLQIRVEG